MRVPGGNRCASAAPAPEARNLEPDVGVLGISDIATVATSSGLDGLELDCCDPGECVPDGVRFAPHVRQNRLFTGSSVEHNVQRIIESGF
jgi:hypothetical protein